MSKLSRERFLCACVPFWVLAVFGRFPVLQIFRSFGLEERTSGWMGDVYVKCVMLHSAPCLLCNCFVAAQTRSQHPFSVCVSSALSSRHGRLVVDVYQPNWLKPGSCRQFNKCPISFRLYRPPSLPSAPHPPPPHSPILNLTRLATCGAVGTTRAHLKSPPSVGGVVIEPGTKNLRRSCFPKGPDF